MTFKQAVFGQAWSWAAARKSGVWHVKNKMPQSKKDSNCELPTIVDIAREIVRIKEGEEFVENFFNVNGYSPYFGKTKF